MLSTMSSSSQQIAIPNKYEMTLFNQRLIRKSVIRIILILFY